MGTEESIYIETSNSPYLNLHLVFFFHWFSYHSIVFTCTKKP